MHRKAWRAVLAFQQKAFSAGISANNSLPQKGGLLYIAYKRSKTFSLKRVKTVGMNHKLQEKRMKKMEWSPELETDIRGDDQGYVESIKKFLHEDSVPDYTSKSSKTNLQAAMQEIQANRSSGFFTRLKHVFFPSRNQL